jgi:hypothetical protein
LMRKLLGDEGASVWIGEITGKRRGGGESVGET